MGEHRRVAEFWSQLWSCYGHKILPKMCSSKEDKCLWLIQMATAERSPEKAGVGGSIPSLATIFNNFQHRIATEYVQKRGHIPRFPLWGVPRKCVESKQLQDRRAQPSRGGFDLRPFIFFHFFFFDLSC
jgi:hypothetical protein